MLLLYTCVGHTLPPRVLRGAAHGAAYARPLDHGAAYARPLVLRAAQPPLLLLDEESGDINDGGISSVNWVTVDASGPDVEPTEEEGTSVMPLFPLGAAYLPHTTPVLNIFEPRYRAMYNDILFNGARRFMVTNVEPETGALAEVGVVFYLDELKEVSEQTQDRVKYIGQHRVINRVRLRRVLNPSVVATRDTYLKAEVEVLSDSDQQEEGKPDEGLAAEEAAAEELFVSLVDAQKSLGEEPRFTDAVKGRAARSRLVAVLAPGDPSRTLPRRLALLRSRHVAVRPGPVGHHRALAAVSRAEDAGAWAKDAARDPERRRELPERQHAA
mmetsp:Transcript_20312/g.64915  ORF Transcript_20312/g.64915 Transcript_20312/m.64915 type:complete len:328 (+) Transcript_20312:32-1015(+)